MIVVDECHCITEWGYTFRDAYLHIGDFIRQAETQAGYLCLLCDNIC